MDNGTIVDLSRKTISYAYLNEVFTYDAILSISEAGVLCQVETEFGMDAYLVSPKMISLNVLSLTVQMFTLHVMTTLQHSIIFR